MRTNLSAKLVGLCVASVAGASILAAEPAARLTIQVDKPGAEISPTMWGVFFEDINSGADGGIYPELVKNRSFEFTDPLMGWVKVRSSDVLSVSDRLPLNANNPHFLRVQLDGAGEGVSLINEGFNGMGVRRGAEYVLSAYVRAGAGASVRAELVSSLGEVLGTAALRGFTGEWKQHRTTLRASATEPRARLRLLLSGRASVDLDMISLFPLDTWKKRPNGLRPDLVQWLADLKPGFVRFPGGCIVEGHHLTNRYQWKTTIGDVAERRLIINRWNNEFKHRPAPDYFQSFGLGFFEYFLLCEDIGAEPLPILNCGMACQFNSGELVPLDQLDPYIQDALDLIEFASGPVTSPWGQKRAALGHPKPFNLKLLGVGNEQWGPQYVERYERFARVLKAKHPEVQLVSSAGPDPDGEKFDFLWPKLRALNADLVDEHYYRPPRWFLDNAQRYDRYDRKGPKIFAGEYAAQSVKTVSPDNRNNWECALAEAAFLTGLERNADVVRLASYAPLFGHEERWQWRPNLIWMDNLRSYGTPNYYVQKLFSVNRGSRVLPLQWESAAGDTTRRLYASAAYDTAPGEVILKLVNATPQPQDVRIQLAGATSVNKTARASVLAHADLKAENSLDQPRAVAPVESRVNVSSATFDHRLPAQSLTVLRIRSK